MYWRVIEGSQHVSPSLLGLLWSVQSKINKRIAFAICSLKSKKKKKRKKTRVYVSTQIHIIIRGMPLKMFCPLFSYFWSYSSEQILCTTYYGILLKKRLLLNFKYKFLFFSFCTNFCYQSQLTSIF